MKTANDSIDIDMSTDTNQKDSGQIADSNRISVSLPAKGARDYRGRFMPGNTISKNHQITTIYSIQQSLRKRFLDRAKPEDLDNIYDAMYDLAVNCPDWKTRLAAADMLLTRLIGKVKDEIEMTVNDTSENRQRAQEILMLWKERCTST